MMKSKSARPFRAVSACANPDSPGWKTSIVRILNDRSEEIGSYTRNYAAFSDETFEPFQIGDAWFALYSRDYTCTRVMRLPECEDIGGEEPVAHGFCPVEFFVPRYREVIYDDKLIGRQSERIIFESNAEDKPAEKTNSLDTSKRSPWMSLQIGFVAGCLWGDDISWKLEVFDLSRAAEGIITRSPRFGHLQLGTMPLAEAVQLSCTEPGGDLRATIIRQDCWSVDTGLILNPYDL